jgi:cytochrome c peroxidase
MEHALTDIACVVYRVSRASYAAQYRQAWGSTVDGIAFPPETDATCGVEGSTIALSPSEREVIRAEYDRIARTIAAFEASAEVNRFSSKFDAWLRGAAQLTQQELMGMMLFQGRARCSNCHTIVGSRPLFTDFSYHNVGTPPNPDAAVATPGEVDLGIGGPGGGAPGAVRWGMVRTPTLRNIDKRPSATSVKPFMHNGAFTTLKEVVRYYNTRDVLATCASGTPRTAWGVSCWPAPTVRDNLNVVDMGNLLLASFQEDAIVAFLKTLSDGYVP